MFGKISLRRKIVAPFKRVFFPGVDKLPEPVTEFHASFISDSEVELAWEPVHMKDEDEQVDHYEIYFKELNNNSDSGSPFDHESVSPPLLLLIFRKCH